MISPSFNIFLLLLMMYFFAKCLENGIHDRLSLIDATGLLLTGKFHKSENFHLDRLQAKAFGLSGLKDLKLATSLHDLYRYKLVI